MTNYINYLSHKLFTPSYYHRDYKHDIKEENKDNTVQEVFKRALNISLPFLSLYRPLGNKISISMGTFRIITSMQSLDSAKEALPQLTETALAITSLSATLFNFRLGSLLTTSSDIFINLKE